MNKSNIVCVRHLYKKNQYNIIERNFKRPKLMD